MDFEEIIKKIFRPDVAKKLIDGISAPPEEQKKIKANVYVSLDDLINLWNAGVENGVNGTKEKYDSRES